MESLHVLWTPTICRPWWPTNQRFPNFPTTVVAECCLCKMPRKDTVARVVTSYDPPLGGLGCYQEPPMPWERKRGRKSKKARWAKPYYPTGAYYDDRVEIVCAPDRGCKKNPRRLIGRHLRERWD